MSRTSAHTKSQQLVFSVIGSLYKSVAQNKATIILHNLSA